MDGHNGQWPSCHPTNKCKSTTVQPYITMIYFGHAARNVLSTLSNWPNSRLNSHMISFPWWKLIPFSSVLSTHPTHSSNPCSRPEFFLTATRWGDGRWHYTGSVMVSIFLLIRAEIHQKRLHTPIPQFGRRLPRIWLKDVQVTERERAAAASSTCWRKTKPS